MPRNVLHLVIVARPGTENCNLQSIATAMVRLAAAVSELVPPTNASKYETSRTVGPDVSQRETRSIWNVFEMVMQTIGVKNWARWLV